MCYQFEEYLHKFRLMHVKKVHNQNPKCSSLVHLHKKLSFLILIVNRTMCVITNLTKWIWNYVTIHWDFSDLKNIRMCLRKSDMNCDIVMTILCISWNIPWYFVTKYFVTETWWKHHLLCSDIVIVFNVVVCNYLDMSNYRDHMIAN